MSEAVEAAAARYLPQGRWAHGFARGKMKGDPAYQAVLEHLPAEGRLVDVGCGEGYLLALVHAQGRALELVGFDHDGPRLDNARAALGELASLQVADLYVDELPEADVLCCLDVLHYAEPAQQDEGLRRLARALRPGGTLLIRDADGADRVRAFVTWVSESIAVLIGRHKGQGVHLRPAGDTQATLEAAGLSVTRVPCNTGTPFANVLFVAHKEKR